MMRDIDGPKPFVGQIVIFRTVKDVGGKMVERDFPGLIYQIIGGPEGAVGLTLFYEGVPSRYGHVPYSAEPKVNHWTELAFT